MLRILFLAANPVNTPPLALKAEALAIEDKLRMASLMANVELHYAWGTTIDELEVQLRSFRPSILHFSGHGSRRGELVVQNREGAGYAVPTQAFVQLLTLLGTQLRCVLLNACSIRQQAEELAQHVDCVIGMTGEIRDTSALHFAGSFYAGLAAGDDVLRAFELGKARIRAGYAGDSEIPQLWLRSGIQGAQVRFVRKVNLFCIYAMEDQEAYKALSVWLRPLQRAGQVELSGLHGTPVGALRHERHEEQFEQAHICILLVSQSFLGSDECYELSRRAVLRTASHRLVVIPVLLSPCEWRDTPFGGLQPLVLDLQHGEPPAARDRAWQRAVRSLAAVIQEQEQRLLVPEER